MKALKVFSWNACERKIKFHLFPPLVFKCSPGICNAKSHVVIVPDTEQGNFPILVMAWCLQLEPYTLVGILVAKVSESPSSGVSGFLRLFVLMKHRKHISFESRNCNSGSSPAKDSREKLASFKAKSFPETSLCSSYALWRLGQRRRRCLEGKWEGFKPGLEQHCKALGKAALPWAINQAKHAEKRLTEQHTTAQGVWDWHPDDSWCILMIAYLWCLSAALHCSPSAPSHTSKCTSGSIFPAISVNIRPQRLF